MGLHNQECPFHQLFSARLIFASLKHGDFVLYFTVSTVMNNVLVVVLVLYFVSAFYFIIFYIVVW